MDKIDQLREERRWLAAALVVACFYSFLALRLAFRVPHLVQDDARQHVFWMQRFRDPALFPNDLIADYFQAVAPAGYKAIYWVFAKLGVDPLLLSKIVPAVIGVATAYFAFRVFMALTTNARGAFFASVLIGQLIWFKDDVISGTPRAFVYPLFLAFILFLLRQRLFACLLMLALEGLIYPQAALVSVAVLSIRMFKWKDGRLQLSRDRLDYVFAVAGLVVVAAALVPFASSVSKYGPVIGREAAAVMPEFQRYARSQFFIGGTGYWFTGSRSGLLPGAIPWHVVVLAIAAPILLFFSRKFPLLHGARSRALILLQIALVAIATWAVAHLFLFKLHLPARYSQWVFRILIAFAAALTVASVWDSAEHWRKQLIQHGKLVAARLISVFLLLSGAFLVVYPHLTPSFPKDSYIQARPKALYEFLRTRQPKGSVIAVLRKPANLIPVFAQRSVLVSSEYAIPYHQGYYQKIRRRGLDLVRALYTSRPEELHSFIQQNGIDLIIVGRAAVTPQSVKNLRWFREIVPPGEMAEQADRGQQPVLSEFVDRCKIWENKAYIVLDARLIAQAIRPDETAR